MSEKNKFIGFILPNGIAKGQTLNSNDDGSIDIIVSVCYHINKEYEGLNPNNQNGAHTYKTFYDSLLDLKDPKPITIKVGTNIVHTEAQEDKTFKDFLPFSHLENEITVSDSDKNKSTKEKLWAAVFPSRKNIEGEIERIKTGAISNLFGDGHEKLPHLNAFLKPDKPLAIKQGTASDILTKANEFGLMQLTTSYVKSVSLLKNSSFAKNEISKLKALVDEINIKCNTIDSLKKLLIGTGTLDEKNKIKADIKKVKDEITPVSKEYSKKLLKLKKDWVKDYVNSDDTIHIDEIINNYNTISHEIGLMRLMGLIRDFKINITKETLIKGEFKLDFEIQDNTTTKDVLTLGTNIHIAKNKNNSKLAFLVADSVIDQSPKKDGSELATYYNNSILRNIPVINGVEQPDYSSNLIRCDKVAIENKLTERKKKLDNKETLEHDDIGDALTRGIMFTNPLLHNIISPSTETYDNIQPKGVTDDFVIRGHRVGLIEFKDKVRFYSLTKRDIKINADNNLFPIFKSHNYEGCVHFDTPTQYMQDGEINSVTSDVLFEYSGELLSLKSAFSKANKANRAEQAMDLIKYNHDSGLFKSQARFEKVVTEGKTKKYDKAISFFNFPFNEVSNKTSYLRVYYDIPFQYIKHEAPKLRFGNTYSFVVYQEYLNGWGLPLSPDKKNPLQLSVKELIVNEENHLSETFVPKAIQFNPLESKRAVQLFHRKGVHDDPKKPITEKASLEHLVVRSDNGEDAKQFVDERHVLPPKIELENGFWHGLLSPDSMNEDLSFDLKRRSNCKFIDEKSYDSYLGELDANKEYKRCPEGCLKYCGGCHMETHYEDSHIYPRSLTDPTVTGFLLELFWDKEASIPVMMNENAIGVNFGGTPGTEPKSYLLRAAGATEEPFIKNSNLSKELDIYLKKGMQVYAQITNQLDPKGEASITCGWWTDLTSVKLTPEQEKAVQTGRNTPKQIALTHAVKEPLFIPEIIELSSTPVDHTKVEHIHEWLQRDAYKKYKLGVNIIAERIEKDKTPRTPLINSSYSAIDLTSHFERLDAIRKIEFLKNTTPTGALELCMRKEEFIDDVNQIVMNTTDSNSVVNHMPNEPLISFSDQKNVFALEHKIEFSNDIMFQLKELKNVEDIENINNVFRSLISKLQLEYDLKSTKFEEREYYLKNISKFKGFFSDAKATTADEVDEFALPKKRSVINNSDLRFKVMVLNNKQPKKPEVAFAVTTIQETRSYPEDQKTLSTQKGNIVTIYLKRGRLTSGKDERIGIIVDSDTIYNEVFEKNGMISKAGRDIVSDRFPNRSQCLQYGDIKIENSDYDAEYDDTLGMYHFLPKFDIEKQLWKFEVELNVITHDEKQLHNPFINFSIVHFQPFSLNYNDKNLASELLNLKNDCRISDVENSVWCYLLPERKLSVYFDKPNWIFDDYGDVNLNVSYDYESLHHFNNEGDNYIVRTNFIVTVEGSNDGFIWDPVNSWLDNGEPEPSDEKKSKHHALLTPEIISSRENMAAIKLKFSKWSSLKHEHKYSNFRVRFVEVEWFLNQTWEQVLEINTELLKTDIVNNEDMRLRFVELIY